MEHKVKRRSGPTSDSIVGMTEIFILKEQFIFQTTKNYQSNPRLPQLLNQSGS